MTVEEVREKFRDCASESLADVTVDEVLSRLDLLEETGPVSGLADLLRG